MGSRLPSSSSEVFAKRVRAAVPEDLFPGLSLMLGMIEQLTQEIRTMDKEVERLSKERYKVTALFRQISGVRRDPTEKSLERQTEWRREWDSNPRYLLTGL